jgi:hypothetical protein
MVVLNGTTATSSARRRKRGEITTTGRRFTISGATNPVE